MPIQTAIDSINNNQGSPFGFKNRIINGAMAIDQRNAGASVTIPVSNVTYALDRWGGGATQASKYSIQQNADSVTPPAGYSKYLGVTSLSGYSVLAADYFFVTQRIEGFNTIDLGFGTANASNITLSFFVRSSLTGTFGGALNNTAATRSYPFTYTISVANTWEQKSITIAGDTTGTWATDNTAGINILLGLGVGSTYSGTAGSWSANTYLSATGATSIVGTNGATFYITGVQLEKGSTATSFDYRPYGTELALCQRYYYPVRGSGQFADVVGTTTDNMFFATSFPVEMRSSPTMTGVLTALIVSNFSTNYTASGGAYSFNGTNTQGVNVRKSGFTSLSTLYRYFVSSTSIVVTADAEL